MTSRWFSALLMAIPLAAQEPAALAGRVTDEQGKAVSQCRIRVFRSGDLAGTQTQSDEAGEFRFARLMPGGAVVEIEREGFQNVTRSVVLEAGKTNRLDLSLKVEGVSQSVFVTAAASPQPLDEIAKASTLLTAADIDARNEFALSEALRVVPGVQINNAGGPGHFTNVRIRGLRADATGVLVDGQRFRDASATQGDATSFMGALNMVGADRVEVMRGSGSSLYGTNAVGGVVNVISRGGGGPLHGSLLAEGGNLGLFRGRASVGGGALGNRLIYSGSLLHLNVTRGVDGNDATRNTAGQGMVRYDFNPRMNLSARVWAADNFLQLNTSPSTSGIPAANFPPDGAIPARMLSPEDVAILNGGGRPDFTGVTLIPGRDDPDSRLASRFHTTAIIFRHALTPRANWQASYQRVHTGRIFEDGPGGGGFQPASNTFSNYRGDIDTVDVRAMALAAPWISIAAGYEFERESYFDRQENNLPPPRTVSARTSIRQNSNAGFFVTQLNFLERRLQVIASGRAQFFQLFQPAFVFTGTTNNYEGASFISPPRALTGDVSVAYTIARSSTKLRAHGGNSYRAPALYERFGGGFSANPAAGTVSFTPYGDPRLAPDRYNSVDAGVDQYLFQNRARVSATWFYTRAVSLTAFDFSGGINPSTDPFGRFAGYINGSGGISRGLELSAEIRPLRTLTLTGAYTYVRANLDRDVSVSGFFRVFQQPRHLTSVVAMNQWTRRFDTNVELFHGGGYYSPFFAVSRSRAFEFPGFTKVDLVAGYRLWEDDRRFLRVYGNVNNLFDQRYYQNGWLAPQATFALGLAYSF
jgi:vitamin B12 transporter